jgi:hypothetical protein
MPRGYSIPALVVNVLWSATVSVAAFGVSPNDSRDASMN